MYLFDVQDEVELRGDENHALGALHHLVQSHYVSLLAAAAVVGSGQDPAFGSGVAWHLKAEIVFLNDFPK